MKHLLLGSKSESRQKLLKESKIKFKSVDQNLDEATCDWGMQLQKLVESISIQKMEHVIIPESKKTNDFCYVLTADTLGRDYQGNICGKPIDKEDAIKKIKSYRFGAVTGTSICLDKKIWQSGNWVTQKRILKYAQAEYIFDIPDHLIEWYLEKGLSKDQYLNISGAVQVEGVGCQFLKSLNGSYSAVLGLPLFELRKALEELGFGY